MSAASRAARLPSMPMPDLHALHAPALAWYAAERRDLPWRAADAGAWAVLVSEVMLQQTPVTRVLPVYETWLRRWPTPAALAAEAPGEAVRTWGRLGYPRRALRLHAAAVAVDERFDGRIPTSVEELRSLPGVGEYTAAAVAAFHHRQRVAVLDTNVRRVLARVVEGREFPPDSLANAERALAHSLLPDDAETAATWSVALMELGALVCRARNPLCEACPLAERCAWLRAGRPAYDGPPRRGQAWHGTDRQCRGRLLAVLRDHDEPVARERLDAVWIDAGQRERCLASLLDDGLVVAAGPDRYALP